MRRDPKCPEKKGRLFILSAPAGTGKSTLVNRLKAQFPFVKETVSCTTRSPRVGEVHGVDYFFMTNEQFDAAEKKGAFLESVDLFSHRYGTLRHQVETMIDERNYAILVIDTAGAKKIKEQVEATSIFISPPSLEELAFRLKKRGTEQPSELAIRLERAKKEMTMASDYDEQIVNDDIESAYKALKKIIFKDTRILNETLFGEEQ